MQPPDRGDDWIALTHEVLPVGVAADWVVQPACGAVVLFSGTVRDHADGRPGVTALAYEAYEEQVVPRMAEIVAALRGSWPSVGRVAMWHRLGELRLEESSVVVAVSAAHRGEAFEAARYGIDALKASVPIWKHERWSGGEDWGLGAQALPDVAPSPSPSGGPS